MTREEAIEYGKMWLELQEDSKDSNTYKFFKMAIQALEQEPILDKIRAEIERQEKWLLQAGYNAHNVDIAFDAVKHLLAESEDKE